MKGDGSPRNCPKPMQGFEECVPAATAFNNSSFLNLAADPLNYHLNRKHDLLSDSSPHSYRCKSASSHRSRRLVNTAKYLELGLKRSASFKKERSSKRLRLNPVMLLSSKSLLPHLTPTNFPTKSLFTMCESFSLPPALT